MFYGEEFFLYFYGTPDESEARSQVYQYSNIFFQLPHREQNL